MFSKYYGYGDWQTAKRTNCSILEADKTSMYVLYVYVCCTHFILLRGQVGKPYPQKITQVLQVEPCREQWLRSDQLRSTRMHCCTSIVVAIKIHLLFYHTAGKFWIVQIFVYFEHIANCVKIRIYETFYSRFRDYPIISHMATFAYYGAPDVSVNMVVL